MSWNPTLFYLEHFTQSFVIGVSWGRVRDNVGIETRNIVIHLGLFGVRIERGLMGGK